MASLACWDRAIPHFLVRREGLESPLSLSISFFAASFIYRQVSRRHRPSPRNGSSLQQASCDLRNFQTSASRATGVRFISASFPLAGPLLSREQPRWPLWPSSLHQSLHLTPPLLGSWRCSSDKCSLLSQNRPVSQRCCRDK